MKSRKKIFLIISSVLPFLYISDCMSDSLRLAPAKNNQVNLNSAPADSNNKQTNSSNNSNNTNDAVNGSDNSKISQEPKILDTKPKRDTNESDLTPKQEEQQKLDQKQEESKSSMSDDDKFSYDDLNDNSSGDKLRTLSLRDASIAKLAKDELPFIVPEKNTGHKLDSLEGTWKFKKDLIDEKGKKVETEFTFGPDGEGIVVLRDSNEEEFAGNAKATIDDQNVKIQTEYLKDSDGSNTYPPLYIECSNLKSSAVCQGTDGWNIWNNEQLIAVDDKAEHSSRSIEELNDKIKNSQDDLQNEDDAMSVTEDENEAQEESSTDLSELGDGIELPEQLTDAANKASINRGNKDNPFVGDWRYSQDFVRRRDGSSVGMEFHFNQDGTGYSVIKDSEFGDSRAKASVNLMKDGSYRIKTDSYKGNKLYYPTFMLCKPNAKKELICDLSNGWLRLEKGVLLSLDSIGKNDEKYEYEDFIPASNRDNSSKPSSDVDGAGSRNGNSSSETNAEKQDNLVSEQEDDSLSSNSEGTLESTSATDSQSENQNKSTNDLLAELSDFATNEYERNSNQEENHSTEDLLAQLSENYQKQSASSANSNRQGGSSTSSKRQSANSQYLSIPKKHDSFQYLKGKWICNTGLVDSTKHKPIVLEFSFDANGAGKANVKSENRIFTANVRAGYDSKGNLIISTSEFYSRNSREKFEAQSIRCESKGGIALCSGKNGQSSVRWNSVPFKRIK